MCNAGFQVAADGKNCEGKTFLKLLHISCNNIQLQEVIHINKKEKDLWWEGKERSKESNFYIPFAVSGRASKLSFAASSGALAWQTSTGCLSSRRNSTYHYGKMQFLWWEWYILKWSTSHMLPNFTVCLTAYFMGSNCVTSSVFYADAIWADP